MKRKTLNKILILTVALSLTFCTIASAKTVKNQSRSAKCYSSYVDPFPYGNGK